MIRIWRAREACTEDALDTIPQKALIHNIPEAMWGDEAIGRIASSLGAPIDARAAKQLNTHLPPPLEVCVIMGSEFGYPATVRIRLEGNEGEPTRDNIVNIEYAQRMPLCRHCRGYGHWTQKCRKSESKDRGEWNKVITTMPPLMSPITGNVKKTNLRQNQNSKNSKVRRRRTRSHRRRQVRMEYRPVRPEHARYGEPKNQQQIVVTDSPLRLKYSRPIHPLNPLCPLCKVLLSCWKTPRELKL